MSGQGPPKQSASLRDHLAGYQGRLVEWTYGLLHSLTGGWPRFWARVIIGALVVFFAFQYAGAPDNNSMQSMLSASSSDDRFYLNEYIPKFGSDEFIFVSIEAHDALSQDTQATLKRLRSNLLNLEVPLRLIKLSSVPAARLRGTVRAEWPEPKLDRRGSALSDIRSCSRKHPLDMCLRRVLRPIQAEVISDDGGRTWRMAPTVTDEYIDRRFGDGLPAQKPRGLGLTCDQRAGYCYLRPFIEGISYLDFLPLLGTPDERVQQLGLALERSGSTFDSGGLLGRAAPMLSGFLLGEPRGGSTVRKHSQIATLLVQMKDLRDRDDLREVMVAHIRNVLEQESSQTQLPVHLTGAPIVIAENTSFQGSTRVTREPAAQILILLLLLLLFYRCQTLIFIPIVTYLSATLTSLGLYGIAIRSIGKAPGEFNWMTSVLAALFVVISVSDSVHLLTYYRKKLSTCFTQQIAMKETLRELLLPSLYTTLITAAACLTIFLCARDRLLSAFGLYGALGTLVSFFYTFLLFAVLLPPLDPSLAAAEVGSIAHLVTKIYPSVTRRRRVLVFTFGLVLLSAYLLKGLEFDVDGRRWFRDSTVAAQDIRFIETRMVGSNAAALVFEEGEKTPAAQIQCRDLPAARGRSTPDRFCLGPAQLKALWQVRRELATDGAWGTLRYREGGLLRKWEQTQHSLLDITFARPEEGTAQVMDRLECLLKGGRLQEKGSCSEEVDAEERSERMAAAERLARLYFSVGQWVDPHRSQTRSLLVFRQSNASDWMHLAKAIKERLNGSICPAGSCRADLTGSLHVYTQYFSLLFRDMGFCFLASLAITWILMLIMLWRDRWVVSIHILCSIVMLCVLGATMAMLHIPLYFATTLILIIIMARLLITNIVHFTVSLRHEFDRPRADQERIDGASHLEEPVQVALIQSTQAVFVGAVTLSCSFVPLLFCDSLPFVHAGYLIITAIVLMMASNILLVPALLLRLGGSSFQGRRA